MKPELDNLLTREVEVAAGSRPSGKPVIQHHAGIIGHLALVVAHPDRTGGMETFCRFLVHTAANAGWRVTVALSGENIYDGLQEAFPEQIVVDPVAWLDRSCAGDREYHWTRILARRKWFRAVRPDVAVVVQSSNTPFRCTIVGARLAGVPLISTHRTMAYPVEAVPSRRHCFGLVPGLGLHRRRMIAKTRITSLLANKIVYNNEAVQGEYEALYGYPRSRGTVIRNAVQHAVQHAVHIPADVSRDMVRAPVTIGFVGRISSDKRLDVLLRAVAMMEYGSKVRVIVYGEGSEQPALAALATALGIAGQIEWRGLTTDVAVAYAQMDIVVLCSPRESSSNMILEAMAAGKPVVVTQVGGMPELVDNGRYGICVPPLNPSVLALALDWLTTDSDFRQRLGERARRKAICQHSPTKIGCDWMNLLGEVAGHPVRRRLADAKVAGTKDHRLQPAF